MIKKKSVALAVAAVCASPLYAVAAAGTGAGHWEVVTPSSPNESAPHLFFTRSHLGSAPAAVAVQMESPAALAEVITPLSAQESMYGRTADDRRQPRAAARTRTASLPNPRTPWSPNESGTNHYAQEMQAYREHVASVEQTRIAVAAADADAAAAVAAADAAAAAAAANAAAAVATVEPATVDGATAAQIDRLLASSPGTPAPTERDRESVAAVNPALVDSRQSATTELRVDTPPADRPIPDAAASGLPQEAERTGTAQSAAAPYQTGANTVAAASSAISGSHPEVSVAAPMPTTPAAAPTAAAPVAATEMPTASAVTVEAVQTEPAAPAQ